MMARNDEESLKELGEAYKAAADNIGFKNLAPKNIEDTLRQGGTFVFKGSNPLLYIMIRRWEIMLRLKTFFLL